MTRATFSLGSNELPASEFQAELANTKREVTSTMDYSTDLRWVDSWEAGPGRREQVCGGMPFPPGTLTACELSHHVSPHAPHASLCGVKKQQSQETMDQTFLP